MFFARPISLKTEVWDRIDTYLNEYAGSHPGFMPNRSAFLEEAAVAFLDAKEAEASGGSSETETTDELSLDDTSTEEPAAEEATEEAGDESGLVDEVVEVDLELEEEPDEEAEEGDEEEEAAPPARKSAKKAAKKSAKKSSKKSAKKSRRK